MSLRNALDDLPPHDAGRISWATVDMLVARIASQVRAIGYVPTSIVGVARGGLIPAVLLAHRLGVERVHSIGARSYNADHTQGQLVIYDYPADLAPGGLLVDDLIDTGLTTLAVTQRLPAFKLAVLVNKNLAANPDFCGGRIGQEVWVTFPWERAAKASIVVV